MSLARIIGVAGLAMAVFGTGAFAADAATRAAAKKVYTDSQEAVVSITAVLKMEMGGQTQDKDLSFFGTVLDEKGLTVVSCMMVDPFAALGDSLKTEGGAETPKGSTSKIKVMLSDGTEIPFKIVYEDPDMDLAFLMPEKSEKPLPTFVCVKAEEVPEAEVLDELVTLQRLPKSLDRKAAVGTCAVVAKLIKPRTAFLVDGFTGQPGMPMFRMDGKMQGLMVIRKQDSSGGGGRMGGAPVLLPMKYILRGIEQAKTAKIEEKKPEAKPR